MYSQSKYLIADLIINIQKNINMENSGIAKAKRVIKQYAKEKEGGGDCSKDIIEKLVSTTKNSHITLPKYISFILKDDGLLVMYIQEQIDTEKKVLNTLSQNMQTDNSAFEGWAVVLKAWLPKEVKNVQLRWDIPSDRNNHYRRFCYRIDKMIEAFGWFSIDETNKDEIIEFKRECVNLQNNCGNKIPEKKIKRGGKVGENAVEYDMVHKQNFRKLMCEHYNIHDIYHQLPVGVKNKDKTFFAGSKAAIDLWGMNGNELTIIELKYENKMVGIISELFFYVCLMRDIVMRQIAKPDAILPYEKELYSHINDMKTIHARMLADTYHPLVKDEKVFSILNNNKFENVEINFKLDTYKYSLSTLTI